MATHRNNAIYINHWKEKHREKYLENNRKCVLNYYYFNENHKKKNFLKNFNNIEI